MKNLLVNREQHLRHAADSLRWNQFRQIAIVATIATLTTVSVSAQTAVHITPPESHEDQRFNEVSAHGFETVRLAVGATYDDGSNYYGSEGAVYMFRHEGGEWIEEGRLLEPEPSQFAYFSKVALYDDVVLVGSPRGRGTGWNGGGAYIFRRDSTEWIREQTLVAADFGWWDEFGADVSLYDSLAVIASPDNREAGFDAGAVYTFGYDGARWSQRQKLMASDADSLDAFGTSVATDGETIIVGAEHGNANGFDDSGSAYLFTHNGAEWVEGQKLTVHDIPGDRAGFGIDVDVDNNWAVVGAPSGSSTSLRQNGAAYVYERSGATWNFHSKLFPENDTTRTHYFGTTVALDGNQLLIGAPQWWDSTASMNFGKVYLYEYDTSLSRWSLTNHMKADNADGQDQFGSSVDVFGGMAFVGAALHDTRVEQGGNTYAIENGGTVYQYDVASINTGVADEGSGLGDNVPELAALRALYPNPFTDQLSLEFIVEKTGPVSIVVFDAIGRKVTVLYDGIASAGSMQHVTFRGSAYPAGSYFIRFQTESKLETKRVVKLR